MFGRTRSCSVRRVPFLLRFVLFAVLVQLLLLLLFHRRATEAAAASTEALTTAAAIIRLSSELLLIADLSIGCTGDTTYCF